MATLPLHWYYHKLTSLSSLLRLSIPQTLLLDDTIPQLPHTSPILPYHLIPHRITSPANNFAKGKKKRSILASPVLVYRPTEHSNGNVSQPRKSGMQESTNPPNSATSTPVSHLDAVSLSFWRPKLWSNRETYTHMSREIYSLVSGILLPKLTSDLFVSTHIPDVPSA
ncbi:hypothetical protein CI102_10042 [Trichoderma harzianum]|uniref:Uncharacterized protein n=1 Tax=Trichoderma harzianum CBS 226.95 TaxID=983964 RepID=A0A2T4ARD1_TRIHA|nr:hypothetical protein M431DRAFT_516720 [Trichoderma harzianum CBS 226.95]PKK44924.1 hypothetical protein CI102_10042 [Trichoderma harzianum]PTB59637.1 hypothetical protein M431DRAFT_516720 [Trichoderma harzianum CBS 226.95]